MPALRRASGFFFLLLLGACASTPPAGPNHLYERNIVFTVPAGPATSEYATGYARQGDGPGVQNVIQAVLQFHGLKRVSQVTLQTLLAEPTIEALAKQLQAWQLAKHKTTPLAENLEGEREDLEL